MATGPITSLGIGSGLDTGSLVEQLVAAQRAPRELVLDRNQRQFENQLSAIGRVLQGLDLVNRSATGLREVQTVRAATSTDESVVLASAQPQAAPTAFSLRVNALAQAQTLATGEFGDAQTPLGGGSLVINVGDRVVNVAVSAENSSLAGISAAINEAGGPVNATVINTGSGARLLLRSTESGLANQITVTVNDADGDNSDENGLSRLVAGSTAFTETTAARDAELEINGVAVTRSTNRIDDLVAGVTLDLRKADPTTTVTIAVTEDRGRITGAANDLGGALNALSVVLNTAGAVSEANDTVGFLQGDSAVRSLRGRLGELLVEDLGNGTRLLDLGFRTDRNGNVTLDAAKFNQLLEQDSERVLDSFARVADRLTSLVDGFGGTSGIFIDRRAGVEQRLRAVSDQRVELDRRLEGIEERFRRQFSSLDSLVAQLQNTGNFLTVQLENLATLVTRQR